MMYPEALRIAVQELSVAKFRHNRSFEDFFATVKSMGQKKFWEVMDLFKREIETFVFEYKRTNGVEQAARELFRKVLCKQIPYSMLDLCEFVVAYEKTERSLEKRCRHAVDLHGDSYCDFFDSLPVVGKELMSQKSWSQAELQCFWNRLDPKWKTFVEGENYVWMQLKDAAKEYVSADIL